MAKLPFFILLATATAMTAVPAAAKAPNDAAKISVPYGDLDLSQAEGRDTLTRRIAVAAKRVCRGNTMARPNLGEHMAYVKCRTAVIADARQKLGSRLAASTPAVGSAVKISAD